MFSDLCFPSPEFQVRRVVFDGINYYIFIFDTICSPKPCQHFVKGVFLVSWLKRPNTPFCMESHILQPKAQNSTFVIKSGGVLL